MTQFNMNRIPGILNVFERFRMPPTPIDQYGSVGRFALIDKLTPMVHVNQPLQFVMLGFPFKSTNDRDKVIGKLPDLAEQATLDNFSMFDTQIKKEHCKGVEVSMVSDGFVFNDILGVSDKIVMDYKETSMDMGKNSPVKWFDLNDFYAGNDLNAKREKLIQQFGISPEKLQQDILMNPDVNFLYRGMIHFMEEELAIRNFPSRNQLQKEAKKIARAMMFRNEAYSNLVRQEFKSHVRLSMHPSINNGAKYSFQLIPSPKAKHSAWHSALLIRKTGERETIHKKDAVAAGYELVNQGGRPYYFAEA